MEELLALKVCSFTVRCEVKQACIVDIEWYLIQKEGKKHDLDGCHGPNKGLHRRFFLMKN